MSAESVAFVPQSPVHAISGTVERLRATFPDREIEVITTARSSVNSYTLLDFADVGDELRLNASRLSDEVAQHAEQVVIGDRVQCVCLFHPLL